MLFHAVGAPAMVSAVVTPQFPEITLIETGETFPNKTPDQVLVIGTLVNGAVFTVQIEGGKRNGSGLQINITGTEGDLKISNPLSFTDREDNTVEGARGDNQPLQLLPVPDRSHNRPPSALDANVLDLAYLYSPSAHNSPDTPTFADAVKIHQLIDLIFKTRYLGII